MAETAGTSVIAPLPIKELELKAVVTRCGCNDPMSHAVHQLPCPTPRAVEDLGTIAFQSKNPVKQFAWRMRQWLRGQQA